MKKACLVFTSIILLIYTSAVCQTPESFVESGIKKKTAKDYAGALQDFIGQDCKGDSRRVLA
jgi:hypothetical protein